MKKQVVIVMLFASMVLSEGIPASELTEKDDCGNVVEEKFEDVDILEVQARDFSVEEILDAYFGEEKWNSNLLTQQYYGEKGKSR